MTAAALRLPVASHDDDAIPAVAPGGRLYPIGKLEAHRRGVLHLAISAFVFSEGDLLIQRRALGKYHCGGLWANTCCTHPHWGEDVAHAAGRRLMEELGFTLPLRTGPLLDYEADVGNGLREHERVQMYFCDVDRRAIAILPDPAEVSETRWISPAALRAEVAGDPLRFTPWLRIYLERYPDLIL